MIATSLSTEPPVWQQQAHQCLLKGDYCQAANLYEQAIEDESDNKSWYWYLGLMLLLQGQEAEAQTTWLLGMADGEPEQVEQWTAELIEVLQAEAFRRGNLADYLLAWTIRQHIREINPSDINNLLHLIGLSILLDIYTGGDLNSLGVIKLLQSELPTEVECELLIQVFKSVLDCDPFHPSTLELAEACVPHIREPQAFV